MTQWQPGWRTAALWACAAAGAMLAGLAAVGCASTAAGQRPATVESCIRFGITAIRHHAKVVVPAACRGLSRAQVNFAVGSALHVMADTGHGKARQREQAIRLSPLLARLVTEVPEAPAQPGPPPAASGAAARPAGGIPAALVALASWLVTVALGAGMLIRRIVRSRLRSLGPGPARRPPLVLGHLGLAVSGLLAWIVYLATGLTGMGWAAGVLLLPVAGLGMALVILGPAGRPAPAAPPPTLIIAAHGAFAVLTITFVLLAVTGAS